MWGMSRPAALLVVLLLLAGCTTETRLEVDEAPALGGASGTTPDEGVGAGAVEGADEHNDHDEAFVRGGWRLHRQAIQMAWLAENKRVSPAVRVVARKVRETRFEESKGYVDLSAVWMLGILSWRRDVLPGELTKRQMSTLERLDGRAFDRRWVASMTANRKGAEALCRAEVEHGRSISAQELARRFLLVTSPEEALWMQGLAARPG